MEGMQWPSGTALLPNETNIFIMKISPDINTDLQQELATVHCLTLQITVPWTIHYSINQSINQSLLRDKAARKHIQSDKM